MPSKKMSRARYVGQLRQPIEVIYPITNRLIPLSSEEYNEAIRRISASVEEEREHRLRLLQHHYGLALDEDWKKLALHMALDHVPGFEVREPVKVGRAKKWGYGRLAQLKNCVDQLIAAGCTSISDACMQLAHGDTWAPETGYPPEKDKRRRAIAQRARTLRVKYHDFTKALRGSATDPVVRN